jgi:hypothetical protein
MGTSGSRRADPGAKRGRYVLAFVDDGDNTHEVDAKDVVIVSQSWSGDSELIFQFPH